MKLIKEQERKLFQSHHTQYEKWTNLYSMSEISHKFHTGEFIVYAESKLLLVTAYHKTTEDYPFLSAREIVEGSFPKVVLGDSYRIEKKDIVAIYFYRYV